MHSVSQHLWLKLEVPTAWSSLKRRFMIASVACPFIHYVGQRVLLHNIRMETSHELHQNGTISRGWREWESIHVHFHCMAWKLSQLVHTCHSKKWSYNFLYSHLVEWTKNLCASDVASLRAVFPGRPVMHINIYEYIFIHIDSIQYCTNVL